MDKWVEGKERKNEYDTKHKIVIVLENINKISIFLVESFYRVLGQRLKTP